MIFVIGFIETAQGFAPTLICDTSNENAGNVPIEIMKIIVMYPRLFCIYLVCKIWYKTDWVLVYLNHCSRFWLFFANAFFSLFNDVSTLSSEKLRSFVR